MVNLIQGELFIEGDYTFLCRNCRGEFPRSIEFFPKGLCKDKLASYCRKCSNTFGKRKSLSKKNNIQKKQLYVSEKNCDVCGLNKQITDFYMSSHSIDGKTLACKKCIDDMYSERQSLQKCFSGFNWVVYFIQDSRNERVKIGSSDDPEQTLKDLQEGSSEKLFLLAQNESGEKDKAEYSVNTLFSLFHSYHIRNGWFEMVPSLKQYISLLNSSNDEGAKKYLYPEEKKIQNDE